MARERDVMRRLLVLALGLAGAATAHAQPTGLTRGEQTAWDSVPDVVRITTTKPDGTTVSVAPGPFFRGAGTYDGVA